MEKPEVAIRTLVKLRSYYQSQYEYFLAKATASKENRERVSLLLQDLSDSEIGSEAFWESDNYEPKEVDSRLAPEKAEIVLNSALSPPVKEGIEDRLDVDTTDDTEREIEAVKALNQAIEIIGSVSEKERGKALHLNFFQKLLEQEMSRSIDLEIVKLYLDEGIKRGYLETDRFDPNCYRANEPRSQSQKPEKVEPTVAENSDDLSVVAENKEENGCGIQAHAYKLPPSPRLKVTLVKTIQEYLKQKNRRRFSIENVIDYLYSATEQQSWSKETKNKVRTSISNVLSRKAYLNKKWKRIKPGIYQPIIRK